MMIMAVVPLLVLGQEAGGGDDEDDATPPADATPNAASGFEQYKSILDRMPFGPLPPNFDPDAPPGTPANAAIATKSAEELEEELSEDEQQIVASVRVSILNVTPSGVAAVGFTDSSAQPPMHYYMKVGEKRDIWEVKEADPAEQTVVLLKNGVEATLKVGEGVAAGSGNKKKAAAHPPRVVARAGGRENNAPVPRMSGMEQLRARRRRSAEDLQEEEARREAAREEARKDAAKAAAEREQQRAALLQIQEELRLQREERAQRVAQEAQEQQSPPAPQEGAAPVDE